jgi:putative Holliday junction resolvase
MRILGIDYGQKKIGVAASDEGETLAFPFDLFQKTPPLKKTKPKKFKAVKEQWNEAEIKAVSKEIAGICRTEKVGAIVVGLPLDLSGKETVITREVKKFAAILKKTAKKPVILEKEFLTTKLAEKKFREAGISKKKIKEKIDAAAAAEILQSYLDRKK